MVTKVFSDAAAEFLDILKYMPKHQVEKIPIKLVEFFKQVANPHYVSAINPYISLDKQNLKPKTKSLLTIIYRNYWCTDEERQKLDEKLKENDRKYSESQSKLYEDMFKNRKKNS